MTTPLSIADVQKLERDNSPVNRQAALVKIGRLMADGKLKSSEAAIAEQVVMRMAEDADVRVRSALARQITLFPLLPPGMADRMARDVAEVSIPVLEHWPHLSDELLLSVIEEAVDTKQMAIARRDEVSERISGALIDTGNSNVVSVLLENEGAQISARSLEQVLDEHAGHDTIPVLVTKRPNLSRDTCQRCMSLLVADQLKADVANQMRDYLVCQQHLPEDMAAEIVAHAREQAVANMMAGEADDAKVAEFVGVLHKAGRLKPTLLLRALCLGDLRLVQMALIHLSRKSPAYVASAMQPGAAARFKNVYDNSRLPLSLRPAFVAAVEAAAQERARAGDAPMDPQRYVPTVINSIVGAYGTVAPADLEQVIVELSRTLKRESEERLDSRAHMRA